MLGKVIARSLVAAATMSCAIVAQAVNIDLVTVGNPGNAADGTGYGSMAEAYSIGKYEVTATQYTEFLNAVAATDNHELYNANMWNNYRGCKILREGSPDSYAYSVAADYADRPVNYVSFWDAARFANWMHNGQGAGDTETGAYTLDGYTGNDGRLISRNVNATWFLPSEDEWYKAAYHDKSAGLAASYFDYPTGTNSDPSRDMTEGSNPGNNANFYWGSQNPVDAPYYTTKVGEFELSDSPYGTFDQGGNLWEWNDTIDDNGVYRVRRGGAFGDYRKNLLFSTHGADYSDYEDSQQGFRMASVVPEPASIAMLIGTALMGLLCYAWRKRR